MLKARDCNAWTCLGDIKAVDPLVPLNMALSESWLLSKCIILCFEQGAWGNFGNNFQSCSWALRSDRKLEGVFLYIGDGGLQEAACDICKIYLLVGVRVVQGERRSKTRGVAKSMQQKITWGGAVSGADNSNTGQSFHQVPHDDRPHKQLISARLLLTPWISFKLASPLV